MAGSTRGRKTIQMRMQEYFGTKNMTETVKRVAAIVEGAKTTVEAIAILSEKTEGKLSVSNPAFINFVRSALKAGRVKKGSTLYNLCHRSRGPVRGSVYTISPKVAEPVSEPVSEVQTEVTA